MPAFGRTEAALDASVAGKRPGVPACDGEEAAALLPEATVQEGVSVRRAACRAAIGAAVLLAALLVASVAAVCISGGGAEASLGSDLSLWSARAQIRARVSPVTFGDQWRNGPVLPLAKPPTCVVGELPGLWSYDAAGPELQVRLLTYNLFWWNLFGIRKGNHGSAGRLIAKAGQSKPHDIMAFQECMDVDRVLRDAGLADAYTAFSGDGSRTAAICMAFHRPSWALLSHGSEYVAEDTKAQYFGRRRAQWMRLRHVVSGRLLFFMNHHGPLPVNSGGQCGGAGTAYNLLQIITRHAQRGDAIVLSGDFNADATSVTIQHLERKLQKAYSGTVVNGIDNVFSNLGKGAVVSAANLGRGGSDHNALSVTLALGPPRGTQPAPAQRSAPQAAPTAAARPRPPPAALRGAPPTAPRPAAPALPRPLPPALFPGAPAGPQRPAAATAPARPAASAEPAAPGTGGQTMYFQ